MLTRLLYGHSAREETSFEFELWFKNGRIAFITRLSKYDEGGVFEVLGNVEENCNGTTGAVFKKVRAYVRCQRRGWLK